MWNAQILLQVRHRATSRKHASVRRCFQHLLFPQEESVYSMLAHSQGWPHRVHATIRFTVWLVHLLKFCFSPCGSLLPVAGSRNGPSESGRSLPVAHRTVSLAWRIQLSHCCLLNVSLACNEWVWLWDPFLKLTLKKFLTRKRTHKKVSGQIFPQVKDNLCGDTHPGIQGEITHWLLNVLLFQDMARSTLQPPSTNRCWQRSGTQWPSKAIKSVQNNSVWDPGWVLGTKPGHISKSPNNMVKIQILGSSPLGIWIQQIWSRGGRGADNLSF